MLLFLTAKNGLYDSFIKTIFYFAMVRELSCFAYRVLYFVN